MKRLLKPVMFIFCLGAIVSCSKKVDKVVTEPSISNPLTDYDVIPDTTDGFTFNYKNKSSNYVKYEWRFGDDTLNTKDVNPTHTFLATSESLPGGKYTTDLKNFSSTGTYSHKYADIKILPDNIISVTAVKTGVVNEVKFIPKVKAKVRSIKWTINDVDPSTSVTTPYIDTTLTPKHTFKIGSFNNFTVTVITDKGSTVSFSRSVTVEGLATDITQTYNFKNATLHNNTNNANEDWDKLVDGNTNTKFGYYANFPPNTPLIYTLGFPAPVVVKLYAIENGNDSDSTRDPKEWYVEGADSNDGTTAWTQLDYQFQAVGFADYLASIGQGGSRYLRFFYYPIKNPQAFSFYRWRVTQTFGAFQIEEFRLYQ